MKPSLVTLFPGPCEVRFGGHPYVAVPLRIKDLAALEHFAIKHVAGRLPHDAELQSLREQARGAGRQFMPTLNTTLGLKAVFGTVEGRTLFLLLALRGTPGIDAKECQIIAEGATPQEWGEIDRVAFGLERMPREELHRRILQSLGVKPYRDALDSLPRVGEDSPLALAVLDAIRCRWGKTFDSVGEMPLSALIALRACIRPAGTRDELFDWTAEERAQTEGSDRPTLDPFGIGFMGHDGASA